MSARKPTFERAMRIAAIFISIIICLYAFEVMVKEWLYASRRSSSN